MDDVQLIMCLALIMCLHDQRPGPDREMLWRVTTNRVGGRARRSRRGGGAIRKGGGGKKDFPKKNSKGPMRARSSSVECSTLGLRRQNAQLLALPDPIPDISACVTWGVALF